MCSLSGGYLFMFHPSKKATSSYTNIADNNSSILFGMSKPGTVDPVEAMANCLSIVNNRKTRSNDIMEFVKENSRLVISSFVFKENDRQFEFPKPKGDVALENGWSDVPIPDGVFTTKNISIGVQNTFIIRRWDVPFCLFHSSSVRCCSAIRRRKSPLVISLFVSIKSSSFLYLVN